MQSTESKWISGHPNTIDKYTGKWIAVFKNKIIASGDTIREVKKQLEKKQIKELPLITKIPREDENMSILWNLNIDMKKPVITQ